MWTIQAWGFFICQRKKIAVKYKTKSSMSCLFKFYCKLEKGLILVLENNMVWLLVIVIFETTGSSFCKKLTGRAPLPGWNRSTEKCMKICILSIKSLKRIDLAFRCVREKNLICKTLYVAEE